MRQSVLEYFAPLWCFFVLFFFFLVTHEMKMKHSQMKHPNGRKRRGTKEPLDEGERGE